MLQLRGLGTIAIISTLVSLSGCSPRDRNGTCVQPGPPESFKPVFNTKEAPGRAYERAQACIHYQAYRLSGGTDASDLVAKAAIAACDDNITEAQSTRWFASFEGRYEFRMPPGANPPAADGSEGPSCMKGSECETMPRDQGKVAAEAFRASDEVRDALAQYAVYRVVEARSLRCSL